MIHVNLHTKFDQFLVWGLEMHANVPIYLSKCIRTGIESSWFACKQTLSQGNYYELRN